MPNYEQVFDRFAKDMDWIDEHADKMRRSYADEYVAVLDSQVVDHDKSLQRLIERLRDRYGDRVAELAIRYVYKEPPSVVL